MWICGAAAQFLSFIAQLVEWLWFLYSADFICLLRSISVFLVVLQKSQLIFIWILLLFSIGHKLNVLLISKPKLYSYSDIYFFFTKYSPSVFPKPNDKTEKFGGKLLYDTTNFLVYHITQDEVSLSQSYLHFFNGTPCFFIIPIDNLGQKTFENSNFAGLYHETLYYY